MVPKINLLHQIIERYEIQERKVRLIDIVDEVLSQLNKQFNLDPFGGYAHISHGVYNTSQEAHKYDSQLVYRVWYGKPGGKCNHGYYEDLKSEDKIAPLLRRLNRPALLVNDYKYTGREPIESYVPKEVFVKFLLKDKKPERHPIEYYFDYNRGDGSGISWDKKYSSSLGKKLWIGFDSYFTKRVPKGSIISGFNVGLDHSDGVHVMIYHKRSSANRLSGFEELDMENIMSTLRGGGNARNNARNKGQEGRN